jgi:hypothetical protein
MRVKASCLAGLGVGGTSTTQGPNMPLGAHSDLGEPEATAACKARSLAVVQVSVSALVRSDGIWMAG